MTSLRQAVLILLAALVPAGVSALVHPRRPPWSGEALLPGEVKLKTVLAWGPKVLWIDARSQNEYEAGHVQDAFQMSTEDFNGSEVLNYLDKDGPLVVYCSGGQCDASKNLVKLLQLAGYKQARIMEDGYPAWKQAGYPTATGKPLVGGGGGGGGGH